MSLWNSVLLRGTLCNLKKSDIENLREKKREPPRKKTFFDLNSELDLSELNLRIRVNIKSPALPYFVNGIVL